MLKRLLIILAGSFILSSCGIAGIHFKVHNPKKQGKYPDFDRETILLGELTPIRSNFDVHYYDLDILLEPWEKKLGGWVEMQATALNSIDSVQIDLDQPLDILALRWENRNGEELAYRRDERAVFIALPRELKSGENFSLHIRYYGKPLIARKPPWAGGLVWKKDDEKNPWSGVACEADGSSLWFPCKDHTSDEPDSASLNFAVANPEVMVVSNGRYLGKTEQDAVQKYHWKVSYPINLYNITFYIGDFVKIEDEYTGINGKQLDISHYVLKPNEQIARQHFQQVKEHIRVYEEIYGEYPWYGDGFKMVESPFAGMEHQSAIAYGSEYKNQLNGTDDYIILHEAGHEWFGNAITADDLAHVWLQEGFTTYGEALYLEKRYGFETAMDHLLFYRMVIKNKRPLVGPVGRRYFDYKDGDVYVKAAWVLHSLRHTINDDELFFRILSEFYQENKMKIINSDVFVAKVNELTGKDYNWFFKQYLHNHKVPFLEYDYADGLLYCRWKFVDEDFDQLPVRVRIEGEDYATIHPSTEVQAFRLAGPGDYRPVEVSNYLTLFGKDVNTRLHKSYSEVVQAQK